MREDLLKELEQEYDRIRFSNEQEEKRRMEKIRTEQPEIYALVRQREEMIFGTLRNILSGSAQVTDLPEKMERVSSSIRTKLTEKDFRRIIFARYTAARICKDTGQYRRAGKRTLRLPEKGISAETAGEDRTDRASEGNLRNL